MLPSFALAAALLVQSASGPQPAPAAEPARPPVDARAGLLGVGLAAAAGLTGGLGLGLGLASAEDIRALEDCADCPRRLPPEVFAAVALNTASLGLSSAAASLLGQAHAARDLGAGRARRAPWISLGGLTTAGGILLVAGALVWRFAEPDTPTSWMLLQGGMSTIIAGSGMLVYGLTYRRHINGSAARPRLVPALGARHVGLALVGRF